MKKNIEEAERALEQARIGLIRGDADGVHEAGGHIAKAISLLRKPDGATAEQLGRMKKLIAHLQRLLKSASAFHEGLARLMSCSDDAIANYSRSGATSKVAPPSESVILHG